MSLIRETEQYCTTWTSIVSVPVPNVMASTSKMSMSIVKPESYGPHPVVLLLMGMEGVNQSLHATARLIAERGFAVVIPDLYHGFSEHGAYCPADFDEALEAVSVVSNNKCMSDIEAVLDWIKGRRDFDADNVMCMGVCVGGKWSLLAGRYFPDRFCCVSSYYASGLESCLAELVGFDLPGELIHAGKSIFNNTRLIRSLKQTIGEDNPHFNVFQYDQCEHNFLDVTGRGFDPVIAATALQKTCRLFADHARVLRFG